MVSSVSRQSYLLTDTFKTQTITSLVFFDDQLNLLDLNIRSTTLSL